MRDTQNTPDIGLTVYTDSYMFKFEEGQWSKAPTNNSGIKFIGAGTMYIKDGTRFLEYGRGRYHIYRRNIIAYEYYQSAGDKVC